MKTKLLHPTSLSIKLLLVVICLAAMRPGYGQIGINTTIPDSSSVLDIKSDTKGLLVPRMSTSNRKALTSWAAQGLLVFDEDMKMFFYYNSTSNQWESLSPWHYGNVGKTNTDLNTDVTLTPGTNVGIGTPSPGAKLHVVGTTRLEGNTTVTNDLAVGNGSSNLTVNGTSTVTSNLTVNGTITGNGSGISNVDADRLDGEHGSYYGTASDVNTLKSDVANLSSSKLDASAFTGDWVTTTATGTTEWVTIGGWARYKAVGDIVFVRGILEFTPLKENLSQFGFNIGTPSTSQCTFVPISTYNLKDDSGKEGESYLFLWAFLCGTSLGVKAPNSWHYRVGVLYYVPLNFFYEVN